MASKLFRSKDRMIAGVCSGIAKTYNLDVSLVRIIAVATAFFGVSIGFWIYVFAWLIIPNEQ